MPDLRRFEGAFGRRERQRGEARDNASNDLCSVECTSTPYRDLERLISDNTTRTVNVTIRKLPNSKSTIIPNESIELAYAIRNS